MTSEKNCFIQGNLTTIAKTDGLKISTQAVSTNGNQVINDTKTVTSTNIYFDHDTEVKGTINNIDLEYFQRNAIIKNDSREIIGNKSFLSGANLIKGFEAESVNNIIIPNLTENLVPIHENTTWSSSYIFGNTIINNNLVVNRINNYVNPDGFVSLNSVNEISGSKIFNEKSEFKFKKIIYKFYENSIKNNPDIEGLFVELNFGKSKWLLMVAYHRLSQSDSYFFEDLDKALDIYSNCGKFLLSGGFNSEITELCMDSFLYEHGMTSLVKDQPCFKSITNPTCIDHVLTNSNLSFQHTDALSMGLSDFIC